MTLVTRHNYRDNVIERFAVTLCMTISNELGWLWKEPLVSTRRFDQMLWSSSGDNVFAYCTFGRGKLCILHQCPDNWPEDISVYLVSSPGSLQPATELFQTQYQPLTFRYPFIPLACLGTLTGIQLFQWAKRSSYSKASCLRTQHLCHKIIHKFTSVWMLE